MKRAAATRRQFPRMMVLAAALLVVGLAIAAPFGLAGKVIGLFREGGNPVPVASLSPSDRSALILSMCSQVKLVTPAGKAPEERCADPNPRIEEIANNGRRLYWKATFSNGTYVSPPGPSAATVRTEDAAVTSGSWAAGRTAISVETSFRAPRDRSLSTRQWALAGASAASTSSEHQAWPGKVSRAWFRSKERQRSETDVKGRTYDFGRPPDREWDSIAAYDASGKEVYRESLHLDLSRRPSLRKADETTASSRCRPCRNSSRSSTESSGRDARRVPSGLVAVHLAKNGRPYQLLRPGQERSTRRRRVALTWPTAQVIGRRSAEARTALWAGNPNSRWRGQPCSAQGRGTPSTLRPLHDAREVRAPVERRARDAGAVEIAFTPLGQTLLRRAAVALRISRSSCALRR